MKVSSPSKPKPVDPISLALMGDHGTGKTTFLLRWPEPGILDLDGNLDGPEAYLRKQDKSLTYRYVQPLLDDQGRPLESEKALKDAIFDGLSELIADPKVQTIGIDSGTKLAESLVWWAMAAAGKETMDLDMWKPWRSAMLKLVHRGRNAGKHFVLLIHEQPLYGVAARQGQPAPKIGVTMSMPSKLQEQFGFTFTDVWRVVKIGRGANITFELHTVSDGDTNLKNSMQLPPTMPFDWARLAPLLKGRI